LKDDILPLVFAQRLCGVFDDEVNRITQVMGGRPGVARSRGAAVCPGDDGYRDRSVVGGIEAVGAATLTGREGH
jgi:hypothetical protein